MERRSEHWLTTWWRWFLPGLAVLDPGCAAYAFGQQAAGPSGDIERPAGREGAGVIIRAPFRRAEARR